MGFKIRGLRWYIAGLLMLVTTINYIDRTSLGVAGPTLKKELRITEEEFSLIIICFQLCYMIMQPLYGRVMDWMGTKRGFTVAVIWWSVANMLHAFARTPLSLGLFRGLLGVGEAGNFPGVAKTNAEWFPPKERTMATGIANIGAGTGGLIAGPLVAWIILRYGWQEAFVITGAIGFVWLILWQWLYHPPEKHPYITSEELDYIRQGQRELATTDAENQKGVWKIVLPDRNFWGIALPRFLAEPAWQFFSYWIPMYFATQRGMDLKLIGWFTAATFLAADAGCFVGGLLSPVFQKLGLGVLNSRKAAVTLAAFIMPLSLLVIRAPTPGWAIFWIGCAAFGHQCLSTTLLTLPADLFPKRTVGTANGMTGFFAYGGGLLFTGLIGWLATHVGYGPIFTTIAFLDILGAAFLWALLRAPRTGNAPTPA